MPPKNRTTQEEDVTVSEPATPEVEVEAGLEEPSFDKAAERVKCIRYVGPASRRVITKEELATLGSEMDHDVEWGLLNQHLVPISDFDEKALAYLRTDGRFQAADAVTQPSGLLALVED